LWESCTFPPHNPARFEDALALHIVAAFKFHRRRPGKEGGGRGQVLEDV
jgi:hypothetical protein